MLRMIVMTVLAIGFAAAEASVPKDAQEVAPGLYKYTDSTGKKYTFRKTPFGVVKSLDEPAKTSVDDAVKKSADDTAKKFRAGARENDHREPLRSGEAARLRAGNKGGG